MSIAADTPPLFVPSDSGFRESRESAADRGRLRRRAIIEAGLLHVVVIAALLMQWPFIFTPPAPEPPAITVALVTEPAPPPEPPPPAPAPPQAKPQPAPPDTYDRVSGKDQETTRLRPAEEKGPAAAPKLAEPEPRRDEAAEFPALKFQPKAPTSHPAPKEAPRETAPEPAQHVALHARLGDKDQSGDPYLNAITAKMELHRSYPAAAIGSLGLHLAGTVVYLIALSPTGELRGVKLERSSGSPLLDQTALNMVQQAAPFPALPSNYPRDGVVIESTIPIYPQAQ